MGGRPLSKKESQPEFSGKAFIALILGAACIGFAPIFVRLSEVGPTSTAFWRVFLAQPFLWFFFFLQTKTKPSTVRPSGRSDYLWLGLAGTVFCFNVAIWHWSIEYTTVANATLFSNMAPVFVTSVGYFFLRERVTSAFIAGLVLTLAGAFLIAGDSFSVSWKNLFGDFLGVLTAVFYGAYLMTVNHLRGKRFSPPTLMAYAGVASCFWLVGVSFFTETSFVPSTPSGWFDVLGLAVVSHVAGQGLIAYGLGHVPTSLASVILLFQPVVAACLAWGLLGEPMQALQGLGGVLVLFGIYTAKRGATGTSRER